MKINNSKYSRNWLIYHRRVELATRCKRFAQISRKFSKDHIGYIYMMLRYVCFRCLTASVNNFTCDLRAISELIFQRQRHHYCPRIPQILCPSFLLLSLQPQLDFGISSRVLILATQLSSRVCEYKRRR